MQAKTWNTTGYISRGYMGAPNVGQYPLKDTSWLMQNYIFDKKINTK